MFVDRWGLQFAFASVHSAQAFVISCFVCSFAVVGAFAGDEVALAARRRVFKNGNLPLFLLSSSETSLHNTISTAHAVAGTSR